MATVPTSYASALIESLRSAPAMGSASTVSLLPNPFVAPVAVQPRAPRSVASNALAAPPILSMPAFVPQANPSAGDDVAQGTGSFNNIGGEPFINDFVFDGVERVRPIDPAMLPAIDENVPPLINPEDVPVPDLEPFMPNVVAPINPEFLPAIEEPGPLVDPNDIPVPDLEPFMPVVSPPPEPEPQPAETFPVPDQAPWEPVDLPPMLPSAPEPEAPQEPAPAETFPVFEPAPWEPIDLPPMLPPVPQPEPEPEPTPAETFPVFEPAPWEPVDLPEIVAPPEPEPEPAPDYTEDLWPSIEEVLLAQEPLLTEQDLSGEDFNLPSDEELMAILDFFGRGNDFEVDYLSY